MGSCLQFSLTSPSLHFKQTGSFLQSLLTSSPLNPNRRALTLTSPILHIRQTGSFLQFLLTSSPLNPDGRAPTIYIDEPFTALQTDGLPLTIYIDEPLLHFKQTGSSLQFLLTSSPLNPDGRALTLTSPYYTSNRRAPSYNSY